MKRWFLAGDGAVALSLNLVLGLATAVSLAPHLWQKRQPGLKEQRA